MIRQQHVTLKRKSADRSHSLYTYPCIGYCHSTSSDQMYSKIL